MKTMLFALAATIAFPAQAALQGRAPATAGGTDYQAVYDTDLHATWIADLGLAASRDFGVPGIGVLPSSQEPGPPGVMDWYTAQSWIAAMNSASYLGVDRWRLPKTTLPDPTCGTPDPTFPQGTSCSGSEMGHLFYVELGGVNAWGDSNPFLAIYQPINMYFWSGTDGPVYGNGWAWVFCLDCEVPQGVQGILTKNGDLAISGFPATALAVVDGDPLAVPVPGAAWFFGSVLAMLGFPDRRRA